MNEHLKNFRKTLEKIAYTQTLQKTFYDFIEIMSLVISNSVDKVHYKEREDRYINVIKSYTSEQQKLISDAITFFIMALNTESRIGTLTDLLGDLFMEWRCGGNGQFFTPQHICNFMGLMILPEHIPQIEQRGYISMMEPCCGAGATVLGLAQAMSQRKYNYQQQLVVTAIDLDIRCVHMAYVQLSLYGIPAVVVHGNSLTDEEWSHWYTPFYVLHNWNRKLNDNWEKEKMSND